MSSIQTPTLFNENKHFNKYFNEYQNDILYRSGVSIAKNNNEFVAVKNNCLDNVCSGYITDIEKQHDPQKTNIVKINSANTLFFIGSFNLILLYVVWSLLYKKK